jgi:FlaA1/EpsC-like NDP-sugar epimerase
LPDLERHDARLRECLTDKSLLLIGGAGTIGFSFLRAALRYKPRKVLVCDTNENGLTEVVRDLRSTNGIELPVDFRLYPVNFGDVVFERLMKSEGAFDVVANFAAHKHVRSEKDAFSVHAMIDNNVVRAKRLLDCLRELPPRHFFCVSTDKAANPVNVMGATKKLMEECILSFASDFKVTTARFANVAFSQGSLLDGFLYRLAKRQPFSAPQDVRRYFVSREEAGELCLLACIVADSGEIVFPKLSAESDTQYFSEIATALVKELGYEPIVCASESEARLLAEKLKAGARQYPLYFFTSGTTGEKECEEFTTLEENVDSSRFHSLGVITNARARTRIELDAVFSSLTVLMDAKLEKEKMVQGLRELLPTFHHTETGSNLDQRM